MALSAVLIDDREPLWIQGLTFGTQLPIVSHLESGDLLCTCEDGTMLAIERKTVTDFLGTLKDERLFPQLAKLRDVSPWAYLVLCGTLTPGANRNVLADYRETGWGWGAVQGALLSVQEMGIQVLNVASDHEYEQAIIRLGNRPRGTHRIPPPRDATIVGVAEQIIASLPGIGADKAAAILAHCGSPAWALEFLTRDNWEGKTQVPGIGTGTKSRVRQALGLSDDLILGVLVKETDQPAVLPAAQVELKEDAA